MASSAKLGVPVKEYLHSLYRPYVDYVDGIPDDRAVGEYDHSSLQAALMRDFSAPRFD